MEIISVIGMVLGVAVLIYLTFKGVNGFVASLVGSVIVIVSSGLPFWGTLTGTYAASLGSTFGSYLFLFTIGSAYSELMKKSGAAESIANFLFAFLGVKATVAGTLIITFLLAYGGVNAFIIIFAVYPVAVPMFRKANVSKLLMPAIFLYGAVVLNVVTPGAPSMLCIALSEKLGVTTFAAPTMAIVLLVVAFGFGIFYFTWASNSLRARGIGFVASESDAELIAGSTSGKELPPIHLAILPYIVIIVLKLVLANSMSASDGINTAMGVGAIVLIITNYKYLKGHIVQDLVTGFTSSINPLLLTAALMGFASVVNACAGFQYFMNFAMMLADKMNPYISAVIVTNVFSGIIIPDKSKQECTFLKGTILLESSKMRYTGANNERFCKQWKGISFCPPPLIGLLAEVYPFPLVGEFPKPPAECWRNSDRTPQNCDGYASLIKEKTGSWALCHSFRFS